MCPRASLSKKEPFFKGSEIIDTRQALSSETSDFEDAVVIETAKRVGADCILTRNVKDYANSSVPVYIPNDFLKLLQEAEDR